MMSLYRNQNSTRGVGGPRQGAASKGDEARARAAGRARAATSAAGRWLLSAVDARDPGQPAELMQAMNKAHFSMVASNPV